MFDLDKWQEILNTIKKNKLRTLLTGFSIAWGIFMLMVLLGAGNGLSNGVGSNFEGNAKNAMWIWSRETSMPYQGYKTGRKIQLTMDDFNAVKKMDKIDKALIIRLLIVIYLKSLSPENNHSITKTFNKMNIPPNKESCL